MFLLKLLIKQALFSGMCKLLREFNMCCALCILLHCLLRWSFTFILFCNSGVQAVWNMQHQMFAGGHKFVFSVRITVNCPLLQIWGTTSSPANAKKYYLFALPGTLWRKLPLLMFTGNLPLEIQAGLVTSCLSSDTKGPKSSRFIECMSFLVEICHYFCDYAQFMYLKAHKSLEVGLLAILYLSFISTSVFLSTSGYFYLLRPQIKQHE